MSTRAPITIPGTDLYLRPSLAEQVEGWCAVGWKARQAVREIIRHRLRQGEAKGKGSRARRRMILAFYKRELAKRTVTRSFEPGELEAMSKRTLAILDERRA